MLSLRDLFYRSACVGEGSCDHALFLWTPKFIRDFREWLLKLQWIGRKNLTIWIDPESKEKQQTKNKMTITAKYHQREWDNVEEVQHKKHKTQEIVEDRSSCIQAMEELKNQPKEEDIYVDEDEIMLGSYLLAHLRRFCENCGCQSSPQWRKGWYSDIFSRPVQLCNACGIKFTKQQFCMYCHYIYGKEQEKLHQADQKEWLSCQTCGRWSHTDCERRCGSATAAEDPKTYNCGNCRRMDKIRPCLDIHIKKMFRHENIGDAVPPSA